VRGKFDNLALDNKLAHLERLCRSSTITALSPISAATQKPIVVVSVGQASEEVVDCSYHLLLFSAECSSFVPSPEFRDYLS
jgi:hypothetical protein